MREVYYVWTADAKLCVAAGAGLSMVPTGCLRSIAYAGQTALDGIMRDHDCLAWLHDSIDVGRTKNARPVKHS